MAAPRCETHGKKLEIFCTTCAMPVCARCILDHPQHTYAAIGVSAEFARDRFRTAQLYLLEMKQAEERLVRSIAQLRSYSEESINNMKAYFADLMDVITRREEHLLSKVKTTQEKNEKTVTQELELLKGGHIAQLRNILDDKDYRGWESVSDVELLLMAKDLEEVFHTLDDAKKNLVVALADQVEATYHHFDGDRSFVNSAKKCGVLQLAPLRVGSSPSSSSSSSVVNPNPNPNLNGPQAQDLSTEASSSIIPPPNMGRRRSRSRARSPSPGRNSNTFQYPQGTRPRMSHVPYAGARSQLQNFSQRH